MTSSDEPRWVFGYGSLMWRPGFEFIESRPATLSGYSRALCVYSHVHRGTPQTPGLVFGLDTSDGKNQYPNQCPNLCKGIAYRISDRNWPQTVEYLRRREQVTAVYLEETVSIELDGHRKEKVTALTYCVDTNHIQYAGKLSLDEQLKFIRQGHGQSGDCREYVISTADHLKQLNVEDKNLQALANALSLE